MFVIRTSVGAVEGVGNCAFALFKEQDGSLDICKYPHTQKQEHVLLVRGLGSAALVRSALVKLAGKSNQILFRSGLFTTRSYFRDGRKLFHVSSEI